MHGGCGFMAGQTIAKAWADNCDTRIAGGSTEIKKEIIGRDVSGQR